jgi:hypothetical protein
VSLTMIYFVNVTMYNNNMLMKIWKKIKSQKRNLGFKIKISWFLNLATIWNVKVNNVVKWISEFWCLV